LFLFFFLSDYFKWFSSIFFGQDIFQDIRRKHSGMDEATIEDLAFSNRSSRAPDCVGRRGCLSEASSAAAEKREEGMA